MDKRKKHIGILQNLLITLLTVSAVLLFAQTQWYNLDLAGTYLDTLSGSTGADTVQESFSLSAPVRVAVTGTYGRYGSVTLTTADEAFEPLGSLLKGALSSAATFSTSDFHAFFQSTEHTSVYYDFLSPLPLSVIAQLCGVETGGDTTSVRRLVISYQESTGVSLYLWDGTEHYLRANLTLSAQELTDTVNSYDLGTAFFAGDSVDVEPLCAQVDPLSLFLYELPELPALTAANVQCDADALLTALDFNPHTNNRYPSSDGSEVINEGSRSLRIHTNGTVVYRSGGSTALSLDVEEETLTVGEVASRTGALLASLSSGLTGDASLYLEEATVSGSSMTLRFGYQAGGVPIYFSDGSSAAEVTLSGATVSSLTLRLRSYTALEDSSILLPLRQALAIAADQEGGELSIGYADSGSNSVRATWLLG